MAVAEFPAGQVVFSPLIGCESGRQYLTTFVIGPRHYISEHEELSVCQLLSVYASTDSETNIVCI